MIKPKHAVGDRVMVRCYAGSAMEDRPTLRIDDCIVVRIKTYEPGEKCIFVNGIKYENSKACIYYEVDAAPGKNIDEAFVFPYQSPGNSFDWQMRELDKPIKMPEPA